MKLLLDEMHAPSIAEALIDGAFDVVAVAAQPALRAIADDDLLEYATAEGRAVVTENVGDFTSLATQWVAEGRAHAGLIFTNPSRFNRAGLAYPGNLITALEVFLADPPVAGASWIWWL